MQVLAACDDACALVIVLARGTMRELLHGGCYCGWVRYETAATPFNETNCHCSICRRTTGGTFVTWFTVPKSAFRLVAGHPTRFDSTPHGSRGFCPRCGTQLYFEDKRFPEHIDLTVSSLDHPSQVPPKDHTRTSAKLAWLPLHDDLPRYPEQREP